MENNIWESGLYICVWKPKHCFADHFTSKNWLNDLSAGIWTGIPNEWPFLFMEANMLAIMLSPDVNLATTSQTHGMSSSYPRFKKKVMLCSHQSWQTLPSQQICNVLSTVLYHADIEFCCGRVRGVSDSQQCSVFIFHTTDLWPYKIRLLLISSGPMSPYKVGFFSPVSIWKIRALTFWLLITYFFKQSLNNPITSASKPIKKSSICC